MSDRICFVNTSNSWGGGEKWHYVAAKLCQETADVTVVTRPQSQLAQKLYTESTVNVREIKLSNLSFLNPIKIAKLYRLFKQHDYQTVVLNLPSDAKCAGVAAKLAGVPNIIYRRGMPHPIRNNIINRFLFGKIITDVIVNSEEIRRSITHNNAQLIDNKRIHTIYNGVNIDDYRIKNHTEDNSPIILGTSGRCVSQKNQMMLLKMAKTLKDKGYNFKLKIAGTGPLLGEIRQKALELGVDSNVELLGFVEDAKSMLQEIDIFVFPSHYEGSANALIEASATGLPLVSFNVSSMPEIVIHNETGKLARYECHDDFLGQVESLLQDATLRAKLGASARALAEKKFNNAIIFEQIQTKLLNT